MRTVWLVVLTALHLFASAQQSKRKPAEADPIVNIQFNYVWNEPSADLAKRFGSFHTIAAGVMYKTQRNWVGTADVAYQFGSNVNDLNFLVNLTNSNGVILNSSGFPANYNVGMRGMGAFVKGGKLFPVTRANPNSGILLLAGGGWYAHKINIATPRNDIPTLTESLKKGYDRLSSGMALTQFIGYSYQSANRFYNFYIGVDAMQAFTQSVRKYNFDTQLPDTEKRLDATFGIRVGIMIPIYLQAKNFDYEYEYR
ncbi:MAG: hypothetical protein MUE96_10900 [Bacteroidia bacterium]|jgi:hypothetical protein|nr:hypothetical protein [Bacteroidia bacterium]